MNIPNPPAPSYTMLMTPNQAKEFCDRIQHLIANREDLEIPLLRHQKSMLYFRGAVTFFIIGFTLLIINLKGLSVISFTNFAIFMFWGCVNYFSNNPQQRADVADYLYACRWARRMKSQR